MAIAAAQKLECSICQEMTRPRPKHQGAAPRAERFNYNFQIDGFEVKTVDGVSIYMIMVIDEASRLSIAIPTSAHRAI
eukprot:15973733-Heterocapsa_arctica.AAC.1